MTPETPSQSDEVFQPNYGERAGVNTCQAFLRLTGPGVLPAKITKNLGVIPARSWAHGDRVPGREVVRPNGLWIWRSKALRSTSPEQHCLALIATFSGKESILAEIQREQNARVSVGIWFGPDHYPSGFELRSSTVAALAAMCSDFVYTLSWAPDLEEETTE